MLRNIAAGKAAVGPLNTSDSEIIAVLIPQEELVAANTKLNNYKSCLKLETPLYLVMTH